MDLGLIMHKSATPSRECAHVEVEKEATLSVYRIRRKIVNRVNDTILRLYKCILRPQLEYYMQVIIAIYRTWKD